VASRPTFYGVLAILAAGFLVSSSLAVFYYYQYQDQASVSQRYANELTTALSRASSLSTNLDASLADYRATLSLLADAIANLNTSAPVYVNASNALASLWTSYRTLADLSGGGAVAYSVDIKTDFGNGTRSWRNGTLVEPGWNGYVVTLAVFSGRVQAVWYPQYQEHFVTGIDGVASSSSNSWFVWEYQGGSWQLLTTGADSLHAYNGTMIAWTLCGYDVTFNPVCTP
jgi:hypothetical protein